MWDLDDQTTRRNIYSIKQVDMQGAVMVATCLARAFVHYIEALFWFCLSLPCKIMSILRHYITSESVKTSLNIQCFWLGITDLSGRTP